MALSQAKVFTRKLDSKNSRDFGILCQEPMAAKRRFLRSFRNGDAGNLYLRNAEKPRLDNSSQNRVKYQNKEEKNTLNMILELAENLRAKGIPTEFVDKFLETVYSNEERLPDMNTVHTVTYYFKKRKISGLCALSINFLRGLGKADYYIIINQQPFDFVCSLFSTTDVLPSFKKLEMLREPEIVYELRAWRKNPLLPLSLKRNCGDPDFANDPYYSHRRSVIAAPPPEKKRKRGLPEFDLRGTEKRYSEKFASEKENFELARLQHNLKFCKN